MGKYFVLPIAMTLKNNKIASHGDIVDESQLNSSPYELIKGGFIRNLTDEEAKEHGEDFEEAEIVEDDLTYEEKEAAEAKAKADAEAQQTKSSQDANSGKSAKDIAKENLTKK